MEEYASLEQYLIDNDCYSINTVKKLNLCALSTCF